MAHEIVNDKATGKFVRQYSCDSCQLLRINGIVTHEPRCPEAWKDEKRECNFCGSEFEPEERFQKSCSHSCAVMYSGNDCDCEECNPFAEDEEID